MQKGRGGGGQRQCGGFYSQPTGLGFGGFAQPLLSSSFSPNNPLLPPAAPVDGGSGTLWMDVTVAPSRASGGPKIGHGCTHVSR